MSASSIRRSPRRKRPNSQPLPSRPNPRPLPEREGESDGAGIFFLFWFPFPTKLSAVPFVPLHLMERARRPRRGEEGKGLGVRYRYAIASATHPPSTDGSKSHAVMMRDAITTPLPIDTPR